MPKEQEKLMRGGQVEKIVVSKFMFHALLLAVFVAVLSIWMMADRLIICTRALP